MTQEEYQEKLDKFDWHYRSSDDHRAYLRGSAEEKELLQLAKKDELLLSIYRAKEKEIFPNS